MSIPGAMPGGDCLTPADTDAMAAAVAERRFLATVEHTLQANRSGSEIFLLRYM
jgi:hypothetical protein